MASVGLSVHKKVHDTSNEPCMYYLPFTVCICICSTFYTASTAGLANRRQSFCVTRQQIEISHVSSIGLRLCGPFDSRLDEGGKLHRQEGGRGGVGGWNLEGYITHRRRVNAYASIKVRHSKSSVLFTLYVWFGNISKDDIV
jgi:hypothetical protein